MKPVILVSLDWLRPLDPRTGLGVASITAALRQAGIVVQVVGDAVNRMGFDLDIFIAQVMSAIKDAGPGTIVGISAFVWNEPEVVPLMRQIRANTNATIVLGGPQVSYVGKGELEAIYPEVHLFVRGHGEAAMIAIAHNRTLTGLGIHQAGTEDREERADLDLSRLPSPHLDGTLPMGASVRWETQRGCPFSCSFCQHREPGNRLRNRNLDENRITAEAHAFASASVRRISILDPIFHANRERAIRMLQMFRAAKLTAQLSLQCRFELITEDFLDALENLDVVLEFGLQTIHEAEWRAIQRPNKIDLVASVINKLHDRQLPFEVSLIYGLPHQTLDSFSHSVEWCLAHRVPHVRAWPLMLLRGTPLHKERERWGLVESTGTRIPIVIKSHTFSQIDHENMTRIAINLAK